MTKYSFTSANTSFTTLTVPQNVFLERFLRGTDRTLTEAQASATYGIQNLRARVSELRDIGLNVKTVKTATGKTAYRISARDYSGSRAKVFA